MIDDCYTCQQILSKAARQRSWHCYLHNRTVSYVNHRMDFQNYLRYMTNYDFVNQRY